MRGSESGTLAWYVKHLWICPHDPRCFHQDICALATQAGVIVVEHTDEIRRYVRLRRSGLSMRETLEQL